MARPCIASEASDATPGKIERTCQSKNAAIHTPAEVSECTGPQGHVCTLCVRFVVALLLTMTSLRARGCRLIAEFEIAEWLASSVPWTQSHHRSVRLRRRRYVRTHRAGTDAMRSQLVGAAPVLGLRIYARLPTSSVL